MNPTITAREMRAAIGLSDKSVGGFIRYCRRFPHAFVVVQAGRRGRGKGGASNATLYERAAFAKWLRLRKQYKGE